MMTSLLAAAMLLCALAQAGLPSRFKQVLASADGGEPVRLADYKGKVVLLYFWTTYCVPCREAKPAFEELQKRYADRRLVVLAVDNGESLGVVTRYLEAHPLALKVVLDPDRSVARRLLLRGEPSVALFDTNDRLVWSAAGLGPSSIDDLTWRLERALPGAPGSVPVGKLPRP